MSEQQTSYRQIMKATSLFGGVQVFNIVISIIRSKVVAVLLGPSGMGIMGLLTSSIGIIGSLTNSGLGTSAVKDIAAAHESQDTGRISTIITVIRRLVWLTGLLGAVSALILSPWLSQLTFNNREYTLAFVWISITLLFSQLSSGQLVVLQGMRRLKELAQANLAGSALGLAVTLPFYYFYKMDGIVPGIIGSALVTLLLSWYYSRRIKIIPAKVTFHQTYKEGRNMLKMGFLISLGGLLSVGASYIIRVIIGRIGGMDQVGLYNAGFAIINTYVGLIFNAMATDYYPRLSAVAHNNQLCKQTINQQAEIALLILAPILLVFLIYINWVVIFLYSKQFIGVNDMIYWATLGMFFKAASWTIGFIFLAKSDSKIFFWSEFVANIYTFIFNVLGYYYWGLSGLGFSFLISYILFLFQVYLIAKIKFEFSFNPAFIRIFSIQFCMALSGFLTIHFLPQPWAYLVGSLLVAISCGYSLMELNNRLNIRQIFIKLRSK